MKTEIQYNHYDIKQNELAARKEEQVEASTVEASTGVPELATSTHDQDTSQKERGDSRKQIWIDILVYTNLHVKNHVAIA